MRLLWLCRWSGASLVKMYSLEFFFFFLLCGERQRLEDREGKIIQIEKYWAGKWSVINYWSSWTSRFFISEHVLCCGIVVEFRYFILNAGLSGTFFYYCVITQVDDLKAPSTTVWISLRWETCRCHRQCFPLLPVCVISDDHVPLWKHSKEGSVVFIGPMRLRGCFLGFYLHFFFCIDYCVWRRWTAALKSHSADIRVFVFSLLKLPARVSRQPFEEEAFTLLGDNVITWQSRKCDPPVWPVNTSVTALSLRSHTNASTRGFGRTL